jgi:glutamine synthetase
MSSEYRSFLALSYDELEQLNLQAKADRLNRVAPDKIREDRLKYLTDEKHIKAVTVMFSDLEGRIHLLDYDKKFLVNSYDNLTFDGSSIRGFTVQKESDLRLGIDWSAFYWVPADVFGSGKVLVFGTVIDKGGEPYSGDLRGVLKRYADKLFKEKGWTLNAANEIEGFLFAGLDAEKKYHETGKFEFVNTGGYYHSLPLDPLRKFIDTAADQIQLYKLLCRQVAANMGYTASFLPKPVVGVNGSGMHTNMSISEGKTNLFWDEKCPEKLSTFGWEYLDRILTHGLDLCLIMNPSVNAYRRLDPHYEAPNQLKASATDRGAMVRVPIGNSKSMRVEVRAVAPDANPYLVLYSLFRTGIDGSTATVDNLRQAERYLPDNIYDAIADFRSAEWITTILGDDVKGRFADLKQASADRCQRLLGTFVKGPEVQYHHEVYNQALWNLF